MNPATPFPVPAPVPGIPPDVHAAARDGDPVALTRAMVMVPSVNPTLETGGAGEDGMARQTAGWLEAWGFETRVVEVVPGRPNVVGTLGNGGKSLLLNGHLDTVGVAGMTVSPFAGVSVGGRILGRGAADMKAGLGAVLATARAWSVDPGPGRLVVALTCDEEHGSQGMQALVAQGIRADAAVVAEPTSLAVMPAHKGFAWVEVAFKGRAAHGSRPEVGVDAVRHAAAFLQEMEVLEILLSKREPHPLLGHGSFHVGTIEGGSTWSVYPDGCTLTLERRTLPGEPEDGFLAEVERAILRTSARTPGLEAAVRLDLVRPPSDVPVAHPLVQSLLTAAATEGVDPRVEGMTAWVDAAFLNRAGIPAVCFGPGSIAQAHVADEWVDEEEIRVAARTLTRFTRRFLAGS